MKHIKKWQEPFYAIGGFGPGFMYQLVITYLLYYYRPAQAKVAAGALVLAPAAGFALGMLIARILDGVVDIPIAGWTDNLKSKWGRRRPLMVLGHHPGRDLLRPALVPAGHRQQPGRGRELGQCRLRRRHQHRAISSSTPC